MNVLFGYEVYRFNDDGPVIPEDYEAYCFPIGSIVVFRAAGSYWSEVFLQTGRSYFVPLSLRALIQFLSEAKA